MIDAATANPPARVTASACWVAAAAAVKSPAHVALSEQQRGHVLTFGSLIEAQEFCPVFRDVPADVCLDAARHIGPRHLPELLR